MQVLHSRDGISQMIKKCILHFNKKYNSNFPAFLKIKTKFTEKLSYLVDSIFRV